MNETVKRISLPELKETDLAQSSGSGVPPKRRTKGRNGDDDDKGPIKIIALAAIKIARKNDGLSEKEYLAITARWIPGGYYDRMDTGMPEWKDLVVLAKRALQDVQEYKYTFKVIQLVGYMTPEVKAGNNPISLENVKFLVGDFKKIKHDKIRQMTPEEIDINIEYIKKESKHIDSKVFDSVYKKWKEGKSPERIHDEIETEYHMEKNSDYKFLIGKDIIVQRNHSSFMLGKSISHSTTIDNIEVVDLKIAGKYKISFKIGEKNDIPQSYHFNEKEMEDFSHGVPVKKATYILTLKVEEKNKIQEVAENVFKDLENLLYNTDTKEQIKRIESSLKKNYEHSIEMLNELKRLLSTKQP